MNLTIDSNAIYEINSSSSIKDEDKLPEEIEEDTKAEQDFIDEEEAQDSNGAQEEEAEEIKGGISTGDVGIGAAIIVVIGAGVALFINNKRKKK